METSDETQDAVRSHDEEPIRSVTKTFEQLLEEQLASELSAGDSANPGSRKPAVKYLKRGAGLSRFNLKENITPQKEWKPGTKQRQPLVDCSKPVLKPKSKDPRPPVGKHKSVNQSASKASKPVAPAVSRKVATVNAQSPTKPLRRSNTMPVKKNSVVPSQKKPSVHQPASSTGSATTNQKSPLTSTSVRQKPSTNINQPVSGLAHSNTTSPSKHPIGRPSSAMETSTSHIARPTSPRKRASLSPKKASVTQSSRQQVTSAAVGLSDANGSSSVGVRKHVDSSFYANIQDRVQNEAVETEELQVSISWLTFQCLYLRAGNSLCIDPLM